MAILTVGELRQHLALAIRVELSTVPPYLYSAWSIEDQGSEAALLIRSIVVEEMLHAALVTNLLLAVGGEPDRADPSIPPHYPMLLPHHSPDLLMSLAPASHELVRDVFMELEKPKAVGAPAEDDAYESLGQFYEAIEVAIDALDDGTLFANHQPERQLGDEHYYRAVEDDAEDSGGLVLVHDASSADEAIEIIVHQGEGLQDDRWADPAHQELTHYAKLVEIADGTARIGAVRPMLVNPRTSDLPDAIRPVSDLFNGLYRALFLTMDEAFSGDGDQRKHVGRLYGLMSLLDPVARYLSDQPIGGGLVAAPTFEVVDLGPDPGAALAELAARVAPDHPALEPQLERIERVAAALTRPAVGA